MVRNSLLVKKITRNVVLIVIGIALFTVLNTTNISLNKMLTINDETDSAQDIEIIGAGYTDVMIQRWGYIIFAIVMIIAIIRRLKHSKKVTFQRY